MTRCSWHPARHWRHSYSQSQSRPAWPGLLTKTLACIAMAATAASASARAGDPESDFSKVAQPFLKTYCASCHTGPKIKGDFDFTKFASAKDVVKGRDVWENAQMLVQDGTMPPSNKPQPSALEKQNFVEWLEVTLSTLDCTGPPDPGRVTMRRLNREEYNNTIRDLLGVDFHPADNFPSDDVGYGFDNIGDVLTLPPLLMEKYLAAAAEITERVIIAPETLRPRRFPLLRKAEPLYSKGTVGGKMEFPVSGEYLVHIKAHGDQAGNEPVKMALLVDGKTLNGFQVKETRRKPGEFRHTIRVPAGTHAVEIAFLNDFYDKDAADPKKRDRNLHVDELVAEGPINAKSAPPSPTQIALWAPAKSAKTDVSRAKAIIKPFADRAFRRPVTNDELTRLLALTSRVRKDGASLEYAVQITFQAILVSPNFLFRVEAGPLGAGAGAAATTTTPSPSPATTTTTTTTTTPTPALEMIGNYELANRLSYFLWSSMPDEELFASAARGKLNRPLELEKQARRMLLDPKAHALVENFAMQWLQVRRLETMSFDAKLFPQFGPALRDAMLKETEMFFETVMREDRSILDFLDGRYTFVNEDLAKLYQIPNITGSEFRKVNFTDDRRGGITTQASVLAVTSNPTRTSPVKRGKYILEQILGTPPPPPPPGVPELREDRRSKLTGSLRQRMEQHRKDPNCATCHNKMDALGFGMENFNAVGAWRDKDESFPIDPAGVLPGGKNFRSPAELRAILLTQEPLFRKCLTEKLLTYALGRGLDNIDACVVDKIADSVAKDQNRFSRLVVEIVLSDPFRMRRAAEPNRSSEKPKITDVNTNTNIKTNTGGTAKGGRS